jgi:polyphosphate kinase 2 (PPK2 family)
MRLIPERGRIGIFNRSYYEEVLVVRVHPELLARQKLPPSLVNKKIWQRRFEQINTFERYLTNNGVLVLKFFLNVSRADQKKRFLERRDDPKKNWRKHWNKYMAAYEDMIRNTAHKHAPWFVVPADNKWFTRMVVAGAITQAMESLNLKYPKVDAGKQAELKAARKALARE